MVQAPGRFDDESKNPRPPGTVLDTSDTSSPCMMCGDARRVVLYPFEPHDVVRCMKCEFVYLHPMPGPEDLQDIYTGDYWGAYQLSVGEKDIHERIDEFLEISCERVELLARFKSSGRLLDVGCSMGFLVKAAKDAGFDASGIDLGEDTLSEGRERFGVDVFSVFIQDLPLDRKYDAITCYNTIEHIVEAQEVLDEIAKRLRPEGVLALGTHDVECEAHRREKRMWKHIVPPDHVYYFRQSDLEEMGRRAGLQAFHSEKPIDNLIVVYYGLAD